MKYVIITTLTCILLACGQKSSPEGRLTLRTDSLQKQVDSLKISNASLLDTVKKIREEMKARK